MPHAMGMFQHLQLGRGDGLNEKVAPIDHQAIHQRPLWLCNPGVDFSMFGNDLR
jgi:hypothetical protein